jgi:hypothetical protein
MADDVFTIHHGWIGDRERSIPEFGSRRMHHACRQAQSPAADALAAQLLPRGSAESGSQRILDAMGRGRSSRWIRSALPGRNSVWHVLMGRGEEVFDVEAATHVDFSS